MRKFTLFFALLAMFATTAMADFSWSYSPSTSTWVAATESDITTDLQTVITDHNCDGTVKYQEHEVTVSADGDITITVQYSGGYAHKIQILGVELRNAEGTVVYNDYHAGSSGGSSSNNSYTLTGVAAGDYTSRIYTCSKAGDHDLAYTGGAATFVGNITEKTVESDPISTEYYYQIKNVASGVYLAANSTHSRTEATGSTTDYKQLWAFEAGTTEGTMVLRNMAYNTELSHIAQNNQAWPMAETGTDFYVGIQKAATSAAPAQYYISYEEIADASVDHRTCAHDARWGHTDVEVVRWDNSAEASQWVLIKTDIPTTTLASEIVYEYKYNDETKFTQTEYAIVGNEYPEPTAELPYGVTCTKPTGNVVEAGTFDITLTINQDVPFTAAATAEGITNWYYVRMHPSYPTWLGDTNDDGSKISSVNGNQIDENNPEKYIWGFVGDLWNGYIMVNKGTGRQVTLSNGNVTMTESGTAFIASHSDLSGNGYFAFRNGNNYVNANHSAGKVATWTSADGGSTIMLTECPIHTLNVSEAGYATLYLGNNAYIPADVEAYVVAGLGANWANLTQVTGTLPSGNGIIVKADAGEYEFITSLTTAATIETNELRGSTETETITPAANTTYYILAKPEGEEVGLYPDAVEGGTFQNNANKAYLPVTSGNPAAGYSFVFDWAGTTGVEGVVAEGAQNGKIYDITGREVKAITVPGIYIVNGQKVVK